jgi:nucleoside-diphosphate-sugar epimerase
MDRALSVLVTGSAGRVGQAACRALRARGHTVRGLDVQSSQGVDDSRVGDVSDVAQISDAMVSIDVVVHLAATPDEDDFMKKLLPNNIVGVYNVLESARRTRVGRVVLASTGQVVMGHEGPWPITPEMPFTPCNWYASAKVFTEVAGEFHSRVHGLSVIVARLGWCPRDKPHAAALAEDDFGKDVYLSHRDAGRFFVCAVEAPEDIKHCVVFVTSKPVDQARYDSSAAREVLGFEPLDTWPAGTEIVNE